MIPTILFLGSSACLLLLVSAIINAYTRRCIAAASTHTPHALALPERFLVATWARVASLLVVMLVVGVIAATGFIISRRSPDALVVCGALALVFIAIGIAHQIALSREFLEIGPTDVVRHEWRQSTQFQVDQIAAVSMRGGTIIVLLNDARVVRLPAIYQRCGHLLALLQRAALIKTA